MDLNGKVTSSTEQLVAALQSDEPSEAVKGYLAFASKFWRYSFGNQRLILSQCPHASQVASYKKWKELGHQVKRGAEAIWILGPRDFKKEKENGESEFIKYFRPVPIFDVSQLTEPEKVPSFFGKLGNTHGELLATILEAMAKDGIKVTKVDNLRAEGASKGGEVVHKEAEINNQCATLIHEWEHEIRHWGEDKGEWTKERQELYAESVAYIVLSVFSIDIPYSADYIKHWHGTAALLKQELTAIQKDAKYILERILPENTVREEAA